MVCRCVKSKPERPVTQYSTGATQQVNPANARSMIFALCTCCTEDVVASTIRHRTACCFSVIVIFAALADIPAFLVFVTRASEFIAIAYMINPMVWNPPNPAVAPLQQAVASLP